MKVEGRFESQSRLIFPARGKSRIGCGDVAKRFMMFSAFRVGSGVRYLVPRHPDGAAARRAGYEKTQAFITFALSLNSAVRTKLSAISIISSQVSGGFGTRSVLYQSNWALS